MPASCAPRVLGWFFHGGNESKKTADYGPKMYYSGSPLEAARRLTVRTNYRS